MTGSSLGYNEKGFHVMFEIQHIMIMMGERFDGDVRVMLIDRRAAASEEEEP